MEWIAQVCCKGESPEGRYGHTSSVVFHNKILIFGGFNGESQLNDGFILDTEDNTIIGPLVLPSPRGFKRKGKKKVKYTDKDEEEEFWLVASSELSIDDGDESDEEGSSISTSGGAPAIRKSIIKSASLIRLNNFRTLCGTWRSPKFSGKPPCGRYGHTASVVGNKVFIFGGNSSKRLNDVFVLNIENVRWSRIKTSRPLPRERSGHSASVIGSKIFIFGGYAGEETWLNDMHIFNTKTSKWSTPVLTGTPPSGRNYHTASVVGNYIYIFGGYCNGEWLADMHVFNTDTLEWKKLKGTSGTPPKDINDHVAWVMGKNVFIFGDQGRDHMTDLFIYDTENNFWVEPVVYGLAPSSRKYHTASVVGDFVYIFGGFDGYTHLSDVHVMRIEGLELEKKKYQLEERINRICAGLPESIQLVREEMFEAFQEDLRHQRELLENERIKLMEEVEYMRKEVEKERERLQKRKTLAIEASRFAKTRIKLNIGGHLFETSRATLAKHPDSMFGAMFSGRHTLIPDENGYYFIDRDGSHFIYILNFLRDGCLTVPHDRYLYKWLVNEANFYSLPLLQEAAIQVRKKRSAKHDNKRKSWKATV